MLRGCLHSISIGMIVPEMGSIDERSEMGSVIEMDKLVDNPDIKIHCKCTHVKDNEQLISRSVKGHL